MYFPFQEAIPQPYSFEYDIKGDDGALQNRKEESDGYGNVRGSYGYSDVYGVFRQVEYVADGKGFRAYVKTNEPGTDSQNPADVQIQSYAGPVIHEAPLSYDNKSHPEPATQPDATYEQATARSTHNQEYHAPQDSA